MKTIFLSLTLLTGLALTALPVRAEEIVAQSGETLFTLKADEDLGKTAKQRANDVYDRMRYILNNPKFRASDIEVKPLEDYGAKIVANGQLIVPIGEAEARANDSTPMALAEEWAKHLRKVMPKMIARPDLYQKNHHYPKRATDVIRKKRR